MTVVMMMERIGLNDVADAVRGGEEYVVSSYVLLPVEKKLCIKIIYIAGCITG